MSRTSLIIINWIALVITLTVNALANFLPINGHNPAELSAMYPNLFVPAGFTFGIWGFIYLLITLHVLYSMYILSNAKRSANEIGLLVKRVKPLFCITCISKVAWIFAWHFLLIWLSVLIMITLFVTLLLIFRQITCADKEIKLGYMEHISLETPFIIYFSWIAVALIANITALLVSKGWHPANGITWSCVMISVAAIIGVLLSLFWHRPAYTAVIIWAVFGIYSKHGESSSMIANTAVTACVFCLMAAGIGFWNKRKLLFRPSVQAD